MNTVDIGVAIAALFEGLHSDAFDSSGFAGAAFQQGSATNYTGVQKATHLRQKSGGKLPFVIVYFDGLRDLRYAYQRRTGTAAYTAIFYYSKGGDIEQTDAGLQAWHDVLLDTMLGSLMLGESGSPNGVTGAFIRSTNLGQSDLGGESYAVIELPIEVEFTHAVTHVA